MSVSARADGSTGRNAPPGTQAPAAATVVIPFHRNLGQLRQSLGAARASLPSAEILIAADGAREDCHALAADFGAAVIEVDGPAGPATARNRAAAVAHTQVLLFVDTDVVVAPDALPGLCRFLDDRPDVAAVFGAYDVRPPEPNFMSQFKNLSHTYVHELNAGEASTFWAGLGAVRTAAFRDVGGFDERFARPSIEDIELGCRLNAAGYRIVLDPSFRGTHLKRWTLSSVIATDLWARGVPWTQLIHRAGVPRNGLNLRAGLRLSVVAAYLGLVSLLLAPASPQFLLGAGAGLLALLVLNAHFYRWLGRQRGFMFASMAVLAHAVHHLCNGLSFGIGTMLNYAARAGWTLAATLPRMPWASTAEQSGGVVFQSVGRRAS